MCDKTHYVVCLGLQLQEGGDKSIHALVRSWDQVRVLADAVHRLTSSQAAKIVLDSPSASSKDVTLLLQACLGSPELFCNQMMRNFLIDDEAPQTQSNKEGLTVSAIEFLLQPCDSSRVKISAKSYFQLDVRLSPGRYLVYRYEPVAGEMGCQALFRADLPAPTKGGALDSTMVRIRDDITGGLLDRLLQGGGDLHDKILENPRVYSGVQVVSPLVRGLGPQYGCFRCPLATGGIFRLVLDNSHSYSFSDREVKYAVQIVESATMEAALGACEDVLLKTMAPKSKVYEEMLKSSAEAHLDVSGITFLTSMTAITLVGPLSLEEANDLSIKLTTELVSASFWCPTRLFVTRSLPKWLESSLDISYGQSLFAAASRIPFLGSRFGAFPVAPVSEEKPDNCQLMDMLAKENQLLLKTLHAEIDYNVHSVLEHLVLLVECQNNFV